MDSQAKTKLYIKRKRRTNATIKAQFPEFRCVVVRSLKHIYAQIIAANWNIIATASDNWLTGTKTERAFETGKLLAKNALAKKVSSCAFDRNGFLYHWRVKSLCEWIREWWITV